MRSKIKAEVKASELRRFLSLLCDKAGIPKDVAAPLVGGLLETSLRGVDSHGVRLLPHYLRAVASGRVDPRAKHAFRKSGPATGVLDAGHGFGIPAGLRAMEKAMELCAASGVGAVAVTNSSHFGAAAIYALHAARGNMIGFACTHSDSLVFPHGGAEVFLGTNPVCLAAPCAGGRPFVLDMATSHISWNKLREMQARGAKLEPGMAAGRRGVVCTDSSLATGLLPSGGYKGYGLALAVEILCSTLTGMPAGPDIARMFPVDGRRRKLGHFFLALDISRFTGVRKFKTRLRTLLEALRSVPAAPGHKRVQVAGDPEWATYDERLRGGIPLSASEVSDFAKAAQELGIEPKRFGWLSSVGR